MDISPTKIGTSNNQVFIITIYILENPKKSKFTVLIFATQQKYLGNLFVPEFQNEKNFENCTKSFEFICYMGNIGVTRQRIAINK